MGMTTRGRGWRRAQRRRLLKKRVGVGGGCGTPQRRWDKCTRRERASEVEYEDGVACLYEDDGVWEDGVWDDLENAILWFKYSEGY